MAKSMLFSYLVYNPNKGDSFLHQNSKALNQKTNAMTLRKAKKDTKGDCFRFLKYFFFAVFLYLSAPSPKAPTFGALKPYSLCLGYW
jgi:hypothetical protein